MSKKKRKMNSAAKKAAKIRRQLWTAIIIVSVILCLMVALTIFLQRSSTNDATLQSSEQTTVPSSTSVPTEQESQVGETQETEPKETALQETTEGVDSALGYDVELLNIGKYTGLYMEDGSDEIVSGVLMMKITNNGAETIQYAEITMDYGGTTAQFTVSTLLPGATMVLLEKNRVEYSSAAVCSNLVMKNVAVFKEPLSCLEDKLEIQILNGAINVTNISGEDIPGEVKIYYKNFADDIYYGGITYMVRIQGGIRADEVKQIMATHFSESGSVIMFVTCE